MIKKFVTRNYPYLLPALVLVLLHLYFYITNKGYLIFYGDSYEEMLMLYLGGWEKVHQLDLSLWDWSLGYGASLFSRSFYFLTSPFFWSTVIFPKTWIPQLFGILNGIKIYLLWIFSYVWLFNLYKHKKAAFIISTSLAFSGWVLFFYHYNFFLDAFLLYPILLFSIDRYLETQSVKLLIFLTALLAITNFYFLYMFVPFMGLYFWLRWLSNYDFKLKLFSLETLKFIGYVILGLGISSFVFIPSIQIILSTPRLETFSLSSIFNTLSLKDAFRFISSLYTPVMERFDPSYFISTDVFTGIG